MFVKALSAIASGAAAAIVRLEAARRLLAEIGSLPDEVWREAEECVTHHQSTIRRTAAWLLTRRDDPVATGLVGAVAREDRDPEVRLETLSEVARRGDGDPDRMKDLVGRAILTDPAVEVRSALIALLLDRRGGPVPGPITLYSGPEVARATETSFGPGRHDPWLRRLLARVAEEDPDPALARGVRRLLAVS